MPTISGLRRRGYTPEAIKRFAEMIGVAKSNSVVDYAMLEYCIREDLNKRAQRVMVVFDPVKLIITNYPENEVEMMEAVNNPEDESKGKRFIPFSRELYIEKEDFMEEPDPKFFRLAPGKEVRLQHGYYVSCTGFKKNDKGEIEEIYCTYDPESRGGWTSDGRKVKGTIHWVSAKYALDIELRLYDHLFTKENPDDVEDGKSFLDYINHNSLLIIKAKGEPFLRECKEEYFQFLRKGYFRKDEDSNNELLVYNKTVGLKDSWSKIKK